MSKLAAGDKAPEFNSTDQHGNPVTLADFAGKKIVLYFYPKDDTPGCTAESCSFRDSYAPLQEKGFEIIGVSVDNEVSHQKFVTKYELPFKLLADSDHSIVEAYGVWVEKNNYGKKYMGTARETFVIDATGTITHIIKKVDTKDSAGQVLKLTEAV